MLIKSFTIDKIEAGCDEAGRGALAGPVVAAAVILKKNYSNKFLNDSKKLIQKKRFEMRKVIENDAFAWAVAFVNNYEIDKLNILNASIMAMNKAVKLLKHSPELLLVDGNQFNSYHNIPYHCIVGGDNKYQSIAAASILAKVYRDEYMCQIDRIHPFYHWSKNKGYPTSHHRNKVREMGHTSFHRKTFRIKP